MVRNDPVQDTSHWRRGIACFYAGEYERAADQFARYHSFDNVDRENGIWRYLSQRKQLGLEEARRGLLTYEKDDREPFPDVFKLFAGKIEPKEILTHIDDAKIDESTREQRRFYADLYIGLNHAVEGRDAEARAALFRATANKWAPQASYGPKWMWHVGRLNWEQLEAKKRKEASEKTP
jgi:lipoprotein NlpI